MFKIWVKTILGEKMTRNYLYEQDDLYDRSKFRDYAYEICTHLDIPSPLILPAHMKYFEKFNVCKFIREDFVESVDFETLTFEFCLDPERKKKDLRFYP